MIRVILFLAAVTVLAAGFVWFADRPGDVAITWMGYRIETSVMVAALAIAGLVLLPEHHIELLPPPLVEFAEPAVAVAVGLRLPILLPG